MDFQGGQAGQVPVQPQGHEEAGVLVGQLSAPGPVVDDPRAVNLPTRTNAGKVRIPLGHHSLTAERFDPSRTFLGG